MTDNNLVSTNDMKNHFFIDRRKKKDRRAGMELRKNPRLNLSHKTRRLCKQRRRFDNVSDDFYATTFFLSKEDEQVQKQDKH